MKFEFKLGDVLVHTDGTKQIYMKYQDEDFLKTPSGKNSHVCKDEFLSYRWSYGKVTKVLRPNDSYAFFMVLQGNYEFDCEVFNLEKVDIIIDGKKISISQKSYEELKKQLL